MERIKNYIIPINVSRCIENQLCQKKIKQLKAEILSCEAQRRELKAKHFELLAENMKKDVQIEELEKKMGPKVFHEFEKEFTAPSIEKLRSIGPDEKEDSVFIHAVVRGLYEHNIDDLVKKSVTGRSKDNTKEPISPSKMLIMSKMFKERIETHASVTENDKRIKKLNKFIKIAIDNINKIGH